MGLFYNAPEPAQAEVDDATVGNIVFLKLVNLNISIKLTSDSCSSLELKTSYYFTLQ